jgi:hypothetical protein
LKLAAPENMLGLKAIALQNMFRDAPTSNTFRAATYFN